MKPQVKRCTPPWLIHFKEEKFYTKMSMKQENHKFVNRFPTCRAPRPQKRQSLPALPPALWWRGDLGERREKPRSQALFAQLTQLTQLTPLPEMHRERLSTR